MYPAIIIGVILISLVAIVYALYALAGELQGLGGEDDDAGTRTERAKNEKIRREIEQWRNGK